MMQMKEMKTSNIQISRRKLHMNENNAITGDEMMKKKTNEYGTSNGLQPATIQLNWKKAAFKLKYRWLSCMCGRIFHLIYQIKNVV